MSSIFESGNTVEAVIEKLLAAGADADTDIPHQNSPRHENLREASFTLVELLEKDGGKLISHADLERIKTILDEVENQILTPREKESTLIRFIRSRLERELQGEVTKIPPKNKIINALNTIANSDDEAQRKEQLEEVQKLLKTCAYTPRISSSDLREILTTLDQLAKTKITEAELITINHIKLQVLAIIKDYVEYKDLS